MITGLLPARVADDYGITPTRIAFSIGGWNWFVRKGQFLNVNHASGNFSGSASEFSSQTKGAFRLNELYYAIENEVFVNHATVLEIKQYCENELRPAVLNNPTRKVIDSGMTFPLWFWYYQQTVNNGSPDEDFFINCIPGWAKTKLKNGEYKEKIDAVQYFLDFIKNLPELKYINIHFYLYQAGQVEHLNRMMNYVKSYINNLTIIGNETGMKQIISNEAGIYFPGLLPDVIQLARLQNMEAICLYSGPGTVDHPALPISKQDFQNVTA